MTEHKGSVWIVNQYLSFPPARGATRHLSLARRLAARGWTVSLIAGAPPNSDGGTPSMKRRGVTRYHGIRIARVPLPAGEGNGVRRIAGMAAFAAQVLQPAATRALPAPDVVMGCTVHPLAAAAGARLARRYGVPFVYEIRDFWPETMIRLDRLSGKHPAARALYALERRSWHQASLITGPLNGVPLYGHEKGLPERPFVHIPNGVSLAEFVDVRDEGSGPVRLGYFGSHGNTDHLDVVIDAMAAPLIKDHHSEIKLHLFGQGPHKPQLQERVRQRGLTSVVFHDPIGRDELPVAMQSMTALLLPLADNGGLYRFGASPNKLQEYLAAGRPVILNAPFAPNPIAEAGAGVTVPRCDSASWAQGIVQLAALPPQVRTQMGARGRAYAVDHYDFALLGDRLSDALDVVLAGA